MATRKTKNNNQPGVLRGNHLTVITYSDGSTELVWDDDALLTEVREAIASVQNTESVTAKPMATRRKAAKSK